jgi:hypothetical protein
VIVGWTGHRPDIFRDPSLARGEVERTADALAGRWSELEFVCGGQRGVDLWAAAAALTRSLALHLALPLPLDSLTTGWAPPDRQSLVDLHGRAASIEVADPENAEGALAYDRRNEAIVRRSGLIVAVWTGVRRGGTFHTLCAAWVQGVAVEERRLEPAGVIRAGQRGL